MYLVTPDILHGMCEGFVFGTKKTTPAWALGEYIPTLFHYFNQ